ncbi:hypothetical protein N7489_009971 [Penicillium chrysogenum]|uniref:ARS-binding protein n=1 Tax=Penicillium chrysogenum TaxID=5076 RepID=A0ABQ8WVJ4_PENCH|nr:uncharacterized protein N7489_009971 [Penicillium chrysogenum]KAJ5229263.1 hypothetical protein N7489_009971 [Penicillium chrysogenum]KAJ5282857.1 hypothetical protein N7505_000837 [Penicillium chrysogenum]
METSFPVIMDSTDRPSRGELGGPQMVIQQYARYPPTLESTLQSASSLGSARSQIDINKSPPLQRRETPRSLQSSPRGMRSAIPPSSANRSGTSMSPPLFDPHRHQPMKDPADHADSRVLPSRDITDETIDDAYVAFILYCNPNVPSSVDTSDLRKTFRCLPRSDGKSFNIFTLYGLIRKRLQNEELKTWIQLAIELGVEPPDIEKKQSTQKVQQYTVRLKRWMRAMHIDAFFEYCMGLPHSYYTQLPPSGPFVSESRDGVLLEEDLALRALVPQWKPKRGRKRVEDRYIEEDRAIKRPQLDTSVGTVQQGSFQSHSVTFPQSAIPFSAFPDDMEPNDPWTAATSSYPNGSGPDQPSQDTRWRLPDRDASPANYPQSAIIPRSHLPSDVHMSAEPRSAVTPSTGEKSRSRRRHGPAVSSAWPNSNGLSAGKGRGRPPNRGSSSGSFSTFQVNPSRESSQAPNPNNQPPSLALETNPPQIFQTPPHNQPPTSVSHGRPNKLQLQVPQHSGAPVRLATPPRLVVNGVNGAVIPGSEEPNGSRQYPTTDTPKNGIASQTCSGGQGNAVATTNPSIDDIVHVLSAELLRARLTGRTGTLGSNEAGALASAMVINLSSLYSQFQLGNLSLLLAFHLGVGHHFGFAGTPGSLVVKAERVIPSSDGNGGGFSLQRLIHAIVGPSQENIDNDKTVELDSDDDDPSHPVSEATWKQRYTRLRAQMQKKEQALSQYKRKIVESVMADI